MSRVLGRYPAFVAILAMLVLPLVRAQETLADLLAEPGADLSNPDSRERIGLRMRDLSEKRRQTARDRAALRGLPARVTRPNGVTQEIVDFDGDTPVYFTTHNANAAISTGAQLVRTDYQVDGSGVTIGLWDGGSGRATHQEFGSRMVVKDGAASIDHATHVGGTLIAAGLSVNAKGMSPAATVDSYDWNSDSSEMSLRGASAPGQTGKIYLSNHSYGYVTGWNYVNNGTRVWEWYGNGTTATGSEQDFGRYNTYSRDQDALSFAAPYYLIFRSAGNERTDNPSAGQSIALSPGSSIVTSFDPALHPAGDGQYRGGFETIANDALAKNVMTIGSATDAVTNGLRDPSKANSSAFSSWGPTDDGRIKPDLTANGDELYSSLNSSDTSYGSYSGTSMSSPNATGSAALLIHLYGNLFPAQAMRASTLKALLIHTADDRGNPGPDYKFGWGLLNAKAAASLISDHHTYPTKQRITENQLTSSTLTRTHSFIWDGISPIRASLCWTDPAGTATTTSDLRNPRLVNNLNLKLIAPNGSTFFPFVMPFVGTWTQASMDGSATTGINNTDNIEQIAVAAPPANGTYQAIVSFSGTLTNNVQNYSLLLTGTSAEPPPPPPLTLGSITPSSGLSGTLSITATGTGFRTDTSLKLSRVGQPDRLATGVQLVGESLSGQFNLTGALAGVWDVVATNPDASTATLPASFTVLSAVWSENFEGSPSVWTSQASLGTNSWSLTTALSHSPTTAYFAPGPATKSTTNLTSESIFIPPAATNLQLGFWHYYNLQSGRDGGRLEFSIGTGAWFDVSDSGSGAVFASNGYNATLSTSGRPSDRNEFAGKPAWTGTGNGFIQTLVNLTDSSKYAGKYLRIRWRLATDNSSASSGWYVDSIALTGGGDLANQAPLITTAVIGNSGESVTDPDGTVFQIVRGQGIGLTVGASDDTGEGLLSYTWTLSSGPGAGVFFSPNGSNAAKSVNASFEAVGDYVIAVSVSDSQGLSSSTSVHIRVLQTTTDLNVSPASVSVQVGSSQTFTAQPVDQFGGPVSSPPPDVAWLASGGGAIDPSGLFTATTAGGPSVISATASGFSGNASVTVLPRPATITLGNLSQPYNGLPRSVSVSTNPVGLAVAVTYDGSTTPPVAVGSHAVQATIADPNYQGNASGQLEITGITYSNWKNSQFTQAQILGGDAEPQADAEGDGLVNLAEYALGSDPNTFTPPPAFTLDSAFLTILFERPKNLTDITYHAETGSDPGIWSPLPLELISETATTEMLRARIERPSGATRQFLRLRFGQNP